MKVHTVRDDRMGEYTYKSQCYHAFSSFTAVQINQCVNHSAHCPLVQGHGANSCPWF